MIFLFIVGIHDILFYHLTNDYLTPSHMFTHLVGDNLFGGGMRVIITFVVLTRVRITLVWAVKFSEQ